MQGIHRARLLAFSVFLCAITGLVPDGLAQVKIGVVDIQLAISSTKEGKRAKSKLEKLTKKKQKELDDKVEAVKALEDEMQKQMPLLSEDGKKDMLEKYRKEMLELQKLYVDNQTDLAKKKGELLEPILKKLNDVIQDIALSDGYSLILDRTVGSVLYHQPATDLTPLVIQKYNQE